MLESRLAVGCLLVGAWLGACSSGAKNQFDCAVGHADCSCNADGSCADGLVCNNRRQCVTPGGAGRAGAGSATGGSANGGEANGGTGGANANRGGKGGKRGGHDGAGSG